MIIDASNKEIINTKAVYYHDDTLTGLFFDRMEKTLRLTISKFETERCTEIIFRDVMGFSISACDFWGADERILDFEYTETEDERLLPKLFKKKARYASHPMEDKDAYFETLMTFISGDELAVACKQIILERSEL